MSILRSLNLVEPGDIETLNMATTLVHSWNEIEYVRIGVIEEDARGEDGTISFQLIQFSKPKMKCKVLQANLSLVEIDIVIAGLEEAKKRMIAYN